MAATCGWLLNTTQVRVSATSSARQSKSTARLRNYSPVHWGSSDGDQRGGFNGVLGPDGSSPETLVLPAILKHRKDA